MVVLCLLSLSLIALLLETSLALAAALFLPVGLWLTSRRARLGTALMLSVLVVSAIALSESRLEQHQLHSALDGLTVSIEAVIDGFPVRRADGWQMIVRSPDPTVPRRVQVFAEPLARMPQPGECWLLRLRLKPLRGFANPGQFDREAWARLARIGAQATLMQPSRARRCARQPLAWRWRILRQVHAVSQRAMKHSQAHAIALALISGERGAISVETQALLRVTATAHLMAISGLHVGLIAAFGVMIGRRWPYPRRWPASDRGVLIGLLLAALYALVSGLALPAQRALLMLGVWSMLTLARRHVTLSDSLAIAVIVLALAAASQLTGVSFALSASALALLALRQQIHHAAARTDRPRWREWPAAQWLMSLGLAPLTLFWFGSVSVVGPLANLLLIPMFSLAVVPLTFVAALLSLVAPPLAVGCWQLVEWLLLGALQALEWLAGATPAPLTLMQISATQTLMLTGAALAVVVLRGWPGRALAGFALVSVCCWRAAPLEAQCLSVTALDVGHGTAVVWRSAAVWSLYDSGPRWRSGADAGERILLPYWRAVGAPRARLGTISHADSDHDGGLGSLRAAAIVAHWIDSDGLADARCQAGQRWQHAGVTMQVLWPVAADAVASWSRNDRSCVIRLQVGRHSVLLSGDVERRAEQELLALGLAPSTLATVPHHGSRTSSTEALVATLAAEEAWVSAAAGGRWQLPHPLVAARWRRHADTLRHSAESGALTALLCAGESMTVQSFRERRNTDWLW